MILRLALTAAVLLAWGLAPVLSVRYFGRNYVATFSGGNDGEIIVLSTSDRLMAIYETNLRPNDPTYWMREQVTSPARVGYPIPEGTPLEVSLVGAGVTQNLTPWMPSQFTTDDLRPGALTDAEFLERAAQDLSQAFGANWDTPAAQNIAWRVKAGYTLRTETDSVYAHAGGFPPLVVERQTLDDPGERPLFWPGPSIRGSYFSRLSIRIGSMTSPGDTVIRVTVHWLVLALFIGVPMLLLAEIWLMVPPFWRYRRAKRRYARGECVPCGYPLPRPSPTP